MPSKDETDPLQCQIFDYSLQESGRKTHLYEALSYVWGGSDKPQSISIDEYNLPITVNLHAALSRLRDGSMERTIWVDAICINQVDTKEQGLQVQLMAKISAFKLVMISGIQQYCVRDLVIRCVGTIMQSNFIL